MKIISRHLFAALFCVLIFGGSISSLINFKFFDRDSFIKYENRQPACRPHWSFEKEAIRNYFGALDLYINDAFAFRNHLIDFYTLFHLKMGVSAKPENILIGKNGFMFLGNRLCYVIDQTTGRNLFSEEELQAWNRKFASRKKYLEQFGIQFYLVIAPNKHSVYPEYLPGFVGSSKQNRLRQLMESNPEYTIINTTEALLKAKPVWGDRLFYKTDSHWTDIGAYQAYLEIMDRLKPDFDLIEPLIIEKENFTKFYYNWNSNLGGFMNLTSIIEDSVYTIANLPGWNEGLIRTNFQGDTLDVNQYPIVALNDQSIVINQNKPYTVLLLRDSFSMALADMFNNTFGKVIYCHYEHPDAEELTRLVERFKPDLVIYEMVERTIVNAHEFRPEHDSIAASPE